MSSRLFSRSLPLDDTWDVIVAGGGPAGCTAAAAAAREGAKTLLVEQTQSLGGSGTTALVPAWCPFSDREKIIYRGLAEEVFRNAKSGVPHVPEAQLDWVAINPEQLKRVYDALLLKHGAEVRFQTFLSGVERDARGGVDCLVVSDKSGLRALKAKVYIDCTGDGDLAAWAGAEFQKGDEAGTLQPGTHCFILTNVDEQALWKSPGLHTNNPQSPIYAILASGKYPEIPDQHICLNKIGPATFGFNAGHLFHIDNTDPAGVSRAAREGRKIADAYRRAFAEFLPDAFGNAFLAATGGQVGIRETRRIVGDYILTLDDWMARRKFADEICRNAYFIDLHLTAEEARRKERIEVENRFEQYKPGESHGIPYRCLTPRGLRNVLMAGRNISVDRIVHGSIRVMPVCLAMGEAAGLAAALASCETQGDAHAVDVEKLRRRLIEEGAFLPEMKTRDFPSADSPSIHEPSDAGDKRQGA